LGRLRLIRCARHPSGRRTLDHPNAWMLVWRRGLPEYDWATAGQWKTLPANLTDADQREFGIERADADEPDRISLLKANAPLECFECSNPEAPKARKEIVAIIRAIRHGEPLPQGDLPMNCCRRQPRIEAGVEKARTLVEEV